MAFDGAGNLTNRYLYGPAVDQILADEQVVDLLTEGDILWPLADDLGSIRDLASYDAVFDETNIDNHIVYDSFGNVTSETDTAIDHLFGFTGRERDEESDLQYNRARYFDPATGRWISEDPLGFDAGDTNLSRYVGNRASYATDPSGLDSHVTYGPPVPPGYYPDAEDILREWFGGSENAENPAPTDPTPTAESDDPTRRDPIADWISQLEEEKRIREAEEAGPARYVPPAPPQFCTVGNCIRDHHGNDNERIGGSSYIEDSLDLGEKIVDGIVDGIGDGIGDVLDTIGGFLGAISDFLDTAVDLPYGQITMMVALTGVFFGGVPTALIMIQTIILSMGQTLFEKSFHH